MLPLIVPVSHNRIWLDTIRGTHLDFDASAHPTASHVSAIAGILFTDSKVRFYPLDYARDTRGLPIGP